jgi:hypothetical protein
MSIPNVFNVADDPVSVGLVASLAKPGGNLTGVAILVAELTAKRLELLHIMVPSAVNVAVLSNPSNARIWRSRSRNNVGGESGGQLSRGFFGVRSRRGECDPPASVAAQH